MILHIMGGLAEFLKESQKDSREQAAWKSWATYDLFTRDNFFFTPRGEDGGTQPSSFHSPHVGVSHISNSFDAQSTHNEPEAR